MLLTVFELGEIPNVTAEDLARVFREEAFRDWIVLSASEGDFIQAQNTWRQVSLRRPDPWILEYRDAASGMTFRHPEVVTVREVMQAFLSYLTGGADWRNFAWTEFQV